MAWRAIITAGDGTQREVYGRTVDGGPQPRFTPSVNSLPEAVLPIPRDEDLLAEKWEDASAEVYGGSSDTRLPVDTLEDVQVHETHTTLVFRGGTELRTRVTPEYDWQETHLAAEDLLQNNTNLTANVDSPSTSTETNSTVQSATSTADFRSELPEPLNDTDPFEITSDEVRLLQSCYHLEGENANGTGGTASDSRYSGGSAATLDAEGEFIRGSFTTEYDIPKNQARIAVRLGTTSKDRFGETPNPELEITLDGFRFDRLPHGWGSRASDDGDDPDDIDWYKVGPFPSQVAAGDHTIGVKVTSAAPETVVVDLLVLYDDRYTYTFDNTSDPLVGPELYPDAVDLAFEDVPAAKAVTGGRVESSWNDTSTNQAIAVSNDRGDSYTTKSNASTFETDFTDRGPSLRFKATFSRFGSGSSTTPTSGFDGQILTDYTMKADLEDMPLVVDESFNGQLRAVLNQLADTARGDFVWSVEYDNGLTVEWAEPGQRTSTRDPPIVSYTTSQSTAPIVEKAVVKGARQSVSNERFVATHGSAIDLVHADLLPETERVYDPDAEGSVDFERGSDYSINYSQGTITTKSGGDMVDDEEYAIDYEFKPLGEYTADGVTDPIEETFELPELASSKAAEQAAERIVQGAKDPRYEAEVVVPGDDVDWSVVDDLDSSVFPQAGETFLINGVEAELGKTKLTLASREDTADIVEDIATRIGSVSTRV